jgi:hypothetical protein
MITLVLPEPAPWSRPLIRALGPELRVLTPPEPLRRAWMRLAGSDAPDRIRARLRAREAWDRLAARQLPGQTRAVIAPSLGARSCLAEARRRGLPAVLVDDLPGLRQLHEELEAASRAHPSSRLLRRHRAHPRTVARQEAERALATLRLGGELPLPEPEPPPARRPGTDVLLCGLPVARSGVLEALQAVLRTDARLLVQPGEAAEPGDLLLHDQVELASEGALRHLEGVGLVLAPSWVQCRPPHLRQALRAGVPTLATPAAAQGLPVTRRMEPGDASAIRAGILELLGRSVAPWAEDPTAESLAALRRLS